MNDILDYLNSHNLLDNPFFLSIGTLVSEDLAFVSGLFSVKNSSMTAITFILAYSIGVLIGDILLYGLGVLTRKYSHIKVISKLLSFFPYSKKIDNHDKFGFFEEFLVFTRFIPGTRLPTYIYCGFTGYSLLNFVFILFISTVFYAGLGTSLILLSDSIDITNTSLFIKFSSVIFVSFLTIRIFKLLFLLRKLKFKYNEVIRPLSILILRLKFLEFLPTIIFYLPFVPYFMFLLIKYRGFSSALSSNPAIAMSGFVGELKSDIDQLIIKYIPSYNLKLKSIDNTKSINSQIEEFEFPVIAKPDSGMRGTGVALINSIEELTKYASKSKKKFVIQEYYDSPHEWGVFYYRFPGTYNGEIFSIVDKEFPKVIGDGRSTLYELVLKDRYRKNRFDWIFSDSTIDPFYIPMRDERYILSIRGSHSKGCIFWNGEKYLNEEYTKNIKKVLDQLPGFHIGRVDLRFQDLEGLKRGEFKLIEINGAGAESGNMYDPEMSYINTYKILIKQWNLIFKIGEINKKRQGKSSGVLSFLKTILTYK